MKKCFAWYLLSSLAAAMFVFLSVFPTVDGQEMEKPPAQSLPQIYVTDLSIPRRQVQSGDVVRGTITLFNSGNTAAPDVSYLAALVGDIADNRPTRVFDRKELGSLFLGAGERKTLSFDYQLPKGVTGSDLRIRIQTVFGGMYMGWRDASVVVTGISLPQAEITRAKVVVDGNEFVPESGPAVAEGGWVEYRLQFSNPTDERIIFTPKVRIYDRLPTGELLDEFPADRVSIQAGKTAVAAIRLPTFGYQPRVYAVEIRFIDAEGNARAPNVTGRYIILGDMATIQSISADKKSVRAGEDAAVTVFYLRPPFDQFTDTRPRVGEVDLLVTLYNENYLRIGEAAKKIDLDTRGTSETLTIQASETARAIGATAVISKDGAVLASYQSWLSPVSEHGDARPAEEDDAERSPRRVLNIILLLLAGFVLLVAIFKGKTAPPKPPEGQAPTPGSASGGNVLGALLALCMAGAALLASFGIGAGTAYAFTETGRDGPWSEDLEVFVNNPMDGATLAANSPFNLEVSQVYLVCNNAVSAETTWTVKIYNSSGTKIGPTRTYRYPIDISGDSYWLDQSYSFPITAPGSAGDYRILIKVSNVVTSEGGDTNNSWVEGYITVHVVDPLTAPTLDQPSEGPGDGNGGIDCLDDIKLTWSAVLGATRYEVYRDGVILAEVTVPTRTYTDSSAAPGPHSYYIIAVNETGSSPRSNTISVNKCLAPPTVALTPNPNPATAGADAVTWTATPSGGSCGIGGFTFNFVGDDGIDATRMGSTASITHTYEDPGTYYTQVTVSKSGCRTTTATAPLTVNLLTLSNLTCNGSPRVVRRGEEVTWTANPSPEGDYTYSWSGSENFSGNERTVTKTYASSGAKTARVSVTGVASSPECTASITVQGTPTYQEI